MNSHFFLFCYLSFPILILTIVPKSSGSDNEQYTSCSQPFQCSNIPNLGYPFWGGNRPASCGHPNFKLDCQSQAPQITISSIPYRVLSIHISARALTVARAEFWNNPCPSPTNLLVNATLDTAHFAYSDDSQNLTIYYGCLAVPGVANQFHCTTNGTTTTSYYFGITSAGAEPDLVSGCSGSVVVHVSQAVAQGLMSVPPSITITEVLDRGLGLRWDENDTICSECVQSGGVCGFGSGYAFACLCPDQAYPEACNSTRGGSGFIGRRSRLGLGLILGAGARGTVGYIAPEVFSRHFGGVSHKSDVYSYGMMVLEMIGVRKNISVEVDQSSEIYFPHWVYKRLELDEELGLHGNMDDEANASARKMIIVGLWCIQTDPSHRPSMSRVVEMLEGSPESLQIPPKSFLSSPSRSPVEYSSSTLMS